MINQTVFDFPGKAAEVDLMAGWYRLSMSGPRSAAVVTLSGIDTVTVFEFTLSGDLPVYAKLVAGRYRVGVIDNLRSPKDCASQVRLSRLNLAAKSAFFFGKLIESFRRNEGFGVLGQKIASVFNRSAAFGAQSSGAGLQSQDVFSVGKLNQADWGQRGEIASREDLPARLRAVAGQVHFIVRPIGVEGQLDTTLRAQVFSDWSYEEGFEPVPDGLRVFTLIANRSDELTADAFLLMAEAVLANAQTEVIYGDVWHEGRPTAKFGFDPLLHTKIEDLGLPVAIRGEAVDLSSFDLKHLPLENVVRISLPIALVNEAVQASEPVLLPVPHVSPGCQISAIVPTRDRTELLSACVFGLLDKTDGVAEIIVIDNGSVEPQTHALFDVLRQRGVKVVQDQGDFNFSRLCNLGARQAQGNVLAFINNDIEIIRPDWLLNLAGWAEQPHIGAVGTRLFYADDTLQHGGIALPLSGCGGHLFRGLSREACESVPSLARPSYRMAVTAAVLLVEKTKFDAIGGYDEVNFAVTLNDVDLCLRLRAKGWHNLCEPRGEAYHLESQSRGLDVAPEKVKRRNQEIVAFRDAWQEQFAHDPWFSCSLSITSEMPRLL